MRKGARVVIRRDETKYPPRGTWRWFRGKRGTVVCLVRGTGPAEYGVSFTRDDNVDAYFKRYELEERK